MPRLVVGPHVVGPHVVVGQHVGLPHVGLPHVGLQRVGLQQVGLQPVVLQPKPKLKPKLIRVHVIQAVPQGDHCDISYKGPGKVAGKPGLRMIEVWGSVVKDLGPYPGQ